MHVIVENKYVVKLLRFLLVLIALYCFLEGLDKPEYMQASGIFAVAFVLIK